MRHLFAYREPRLAFALAAALTGFVVSFAMVHFGGPNARYLPVGSFHLSALVGAGLAGWIFAGAFGRSGRRGWVVAVLGSIAMTLVGGYLGGAFLWGLFHQGTNSFLPIPVLGMVAIVDSAESPVALVIWSALMIALHILCARLRGGCPLPWRGRGTPFSP